MKEHLERDDYILCPICGKEAGVKKQTGNTEEFIKRARITHGDKYDYSKVKYINAKTPVLIICPVHGEFLQTPDAHLRGQGCPRCSKYNNIVTFAIFLLFFLCYNKIMIL